MSRNITLEANTEFTATEMAEAFANGHDDDQAQYISDMGDLLFESCGGEVEKYQSQLCSIAEHLDECAIGFMTDLIEFHKLHQQKTETT